MSEYAGADWIEKQLKYWRKGPRPMSPLGIKVADFLGELFHGIYHLAPTALQKVDWGNNHHIEFSLNQNLATADFDGLTRLVFLAHHMALRVELEALNFSHVRLIFHQRNRNGDAYNRHPTLKEAVERFESNVGLPEYQDTEGE